MDDGKIVRLQVCGGCHGQIGGVEHHLIFVNFSLILAGEVLAQPTANNLVEDLISNKDNKSSCEDNPATGEKDK